MSFDRDITLPRPSRPIVTRVALAFLLIAVAYAFFRGPLWPPRKRLWDYAVFASAASLWTRGENPYDNALVQANWSAEPPGLRIERDVGWVRSNAPPTTLAVLAPFAALGSTAGAVTYLATTLLALGVAVRRVGRWAGIEGRATWMTFVGGLLLSVPVTYGMASGNPVMLAVPLAIVGLDLARQGRGNAGGVMLALGAALKLQVGLPMIAFAIFWGWRRAGVVAAGILAAIALLACGRLSLAGVEWWGGLAANIAETNGAGGMNDFARSAPSADDQLELQVPIYRLIGSRAAANAAAWSLTAATGIALLIAARRRTEGTGPLVAGTLAAVALLPVYHRTYDALSLLPLIAAAIVMLDSIDRRVRTMAALILVLGVTYWIPLGLDRILERQGGFATLRQNILYRSFAVTPRPWVVLAQSWLAIAMLFRLSGPEKSDHRTVKA